MTGIAGSFGAFFRICPKCEGHGYFYVGRDYWTGEHLEDACSDCGGTGFFLWIRPGISRRRLEREQKELLALFEEAGGI